MLFRSIVVALAATLAVGAALPHQQGVASPPSEVVLFTGNDFTGTDKAIVIDGITNTVATALKKFFDKEIPVIFKEIIQWITNAINPPPDSEINYFAVIALNVRNLVGLYVNQHNMDQILHYRGDLADLLQRYANAPVQSQTYPDKNTIANSLSTAIISNRFLIEAVEYPESMTLHYADIASLHIAVLHNAATTYSTSQKTSAWWVDLDNQLAHYIDFGKNLTASVVEWRNGMVSCSSSKCAEERQDVSTCYNTYTVTDRVTQKIDTCKAISGDNSCDNTCQDYKTEMNNDVNKFVFRYLGDPMSGWETLKVTADQMAQKAKNGH